MTFKKSKNEVEFNLIKFILSALPKNKEILGPRTLKHVYADESVIVSTDSKRLHMITNKSGDGYLLEPGLYEVVKNIKSNIVLNKVETDLTYPNYKQVIPKSYTSKWVFQKWVRAVEVYTFIIKNHKNSIDPDFVRDLYKLSPDTGLKWEILFDEEYSPIVFTAIDDLFKEYEPTAIIMPIEYNVVEGKHVVSV